ncbi:phage gpG-like protein [Laceyella sacchari]|uniref:phage virion morphogenesis protein n=1 Tax=Laceyella sacchari TaxID=37482 RepID=UPI000A3F9CF2|nr:HK97 gp10 family phage protein [Laceyella sacchari]TCW35301.1 phage gpG-like protein [Laceyella sacchari]
MKMHVEIELSQDLKRLLKDHRSIADKAIKQGLNRVALAGEAEAKKYITQIGLVDTGRLRSSINGRVRGNSALVGTNVKYARIHEFGGKTKPHIIRARRAKALRFTVNGQVFIRKSVNHPGSRIKEKAFLRTPINEMARDGRIESIFARTVRQAIEG